MGLDRYVIDAEDARGAIDAAARRFDDLDGEDRRTKASFEAAGATIGEARITEALRAAFNDNVRPVLGQLRISGEHLFKQGHEIITIFEGATADQSDEAAKGIQEAVRKIEDVPDWKPPSGGVPGGGATQAVQ
ncbi:MAG TPA: hypothetical protein GX743_00905 [Actinomycetales bacterium]|nr:hypothetical protein [Actinomycetales bacterium]